MFNIFTIFQSLTTRNNKNISEKQVKPMYIQYDRDM